MGSDFVKWIKAMRRKSKRSKRRGQQKPESRDGQ